MERFNLTIAETPTELSNRVQNAVDELLHLKIRDINFGDSMICEDLWYCKMVINILIVGEYCNHLPDTILKEYNINWKKLIQPRNSFAHTTPEAIRSTVSSYIDNIDLEVLYHNINDITDRNISISNESDENLVSSNIPKTLLKVIHNCFENKLLKPDSNLPLFDDKLIAKITDLSIKTIRYIRQEYTSQKGNINPDINPTIQGIGAIDF